MFRKQRNAVRAWLSCKLYPIGCWFARIWFCHHNARVIADFEHRMSCVLTECTSTMSKPYYTIEAMHGEINAYIQKACEEASEEEIDMMVDDGRLLRFSGAETQSNSDRVKWAEGLILQLPDTHDGRNSWLLNYGRKDGAVEMRRRRDLKWNDKTQAAETTTV